ncbi:MAG: hypothetical protein GEV08_19385 [Acidimicrobiia bacterium]|nr:hypothetical protein [Acidimicrobiia bacterium]
MGNVHTGSIAPAAALRTNRTRRIRLFLVGLSVAVAASAAGPAVASAQAPQQGGQTGGACTVTDGLNKGKKGTYTTDDEGNTWCEGSWGGTECGSTKCESALLRPLKAVVMPTRAVAIR